MDTMMRGDERAAGVISGADPYRELELYLEKVSVSNNKIQHQQHYIIVNTYVPLSEKCTRVQIWLDRYIRQ